MIKYPVKIHDVDKRLVIQSDNSIVCEAYSEEKALAIANSLNAMNDIVEPTYEEFPDKSSSFDIDHMEMGMWYHSWYDRHFKE